MVKKAKNVFVDYERYPVERSEGGDNAYYLQHCDVTKTRPSYAACLKRVADRKHGRLSVEFAACSAAIGKRVCPAQALRAQEKEAGHALFFVSRAKLLEFTEAQLRERGVDMQLSKQDRPQAPVVVRPAVAAEPTRTAAPPKPTVSTKPRLPVLPGETPLEYARRVANHAATI